MLENATPTDAIPAGFVIESFNRGLLPHVADMHIVAGLTGDGKSQLIRDTLKEFGVNDVATITVHEQPLYR
jgi:hypothetical protein